MEVAGAAFLGQAGAVEAQPAAVVEGPGAPDLLRLVQGALAGGQVPESGIRLGLDGGDPVAGGQGAVSAPRHPLSSRECGGGLGVAPFVQVDVGVPDQGACPEVVGLGFLAGGGGECVGRGCVGVAVAVEGQFTGELEEVAGRAAQGLGFSGWPSREPLSAVSWSRTIGYTEPLARASWYTCHRWPFMRRKSSDIPRRARR